jgi:hypothetical protein
MWSIFTISIHRKIPKRREKVAEPYYFFERVMSRMYIEHEGREFILRELCFRLV